MATYHTPSLRTHHSTVVIGDHLFLWGGQQETRHTADGSVETFNVRNLKWQQKSTTGMPPPGKLRYACTAINKNIYYFGGNCKPSECFHNCLSELNTEVLHWRTVAPDSPGSTSCTGSRCGISCSSNKLAPIKKHGCGMAHCCIGGSDCLLVFGGVGLLPTGVNIDHSKYAGVLSHSEFVYTNEIFVFSLNDSPGQWTIPSVAGSIPPPCAYFSFNCVSENKYLLFGGIKSEKGQTNNLYIFSLQNSGTLHVEKAMTSSTARVNWPRRRISHAATQFNVVSPSSEISTHLLVIGGLDTDFETVSDCWVLDSINMTWNKVTLPDCISERFDHSISAFLVSGQCVWIVVIGGLTELDSTRKLNPATELAAMCELVYTDGKWTVGNIISDLNELRHMQSHRRERMLIDRLLEGRRSLQHTVLQIKQEKHSSTRNDRDSSVKLLENRAPADSVVSSQPHWVIDINEIQLSSEILGGGAYGHVTKALFRGMCVAAKNIHDLIVSDYTIQLFTREMDIISKVCHPNIVQFLGATRIQNPILLFELMSASLCNVLQRTALSRKQMVSISTQISYALAYLHLFKPTPIVHRDVSSPNVLLEPSSNEMWKAKLSDFGSANLLTLTGTSNPGNLAYSAPEAESGLFHTPAMDIYSMGVIMMEMVLHRLPCRIVSERTEQSTTIQWVPMQSIVVECIDENYLKRPTAPIVISWLEELELD